MNLKIEQAVEEHIPQIIGLIREFAEFEKLSEFFTITEKDLREAVFGANKFAQCLVAESVGELVGYAIFFPVFKTFRGERSMFLEDLYVSPKMRGRGVGFALLKKVARAAKAQNCVRMDWQALKWNAPALEFYRNLGAESDDENLDFRLRGAAFEKLSAG
jgi:GNAT superfamily N-acetyltransferase